MDGFTIAASVSGLLVLTGKITTEIHPSATTSTDAQKLASNVASEVEGLQVVVAQIQNFLGGKIQAQEDRLSLLCIDSFVKTLTACSITSTALYYELEGLRLPSVASFSVVPFSFRDRAHFTIKQRTIASLLQALSQQKLILKLMLRALFCRSNIEALYSAENVHRVLEAMFKSNKELVDRVGDLAGCYYGAGFINHNSSLISMQLLPIDDYNPRATSYGGIKFPSEDTLYTFRTYGKAPVASSASSISESTVNPSYLPPLLPDPSLSQLCYLRRMRLPISTKELHAAFTLDRRLREELIEIDESLLKPKRARTVERENGTSESKQTAVHLVGLSPIGPVTLVDEFLITREEYHIWRFNHSIWRDFQDWAAERGYLPNSNAPTCISLQPFKIYRHRQADPEGITGCYHGHVPWILGAACTYILEHEKFEMPKFPSPSSILYNYKLNLREANSTLCHGSQTILRELLPHVCRNFGLSPFSTRQSIIPNAACSRWQKALEKHVFEMKTALAEITVLFRELPQPNRDVLAFLLSFLGFALEPRKLPRQLSMVAHYVKSILFPPGTFTDEFLWGSGLEFLVLHAPCFMEATDLAEVEVEPPPADVPWPYDMVDDLHPKSAVSRGLSSFMGFPIKERQKHLCLPVFAHIWTRPMSGLLWMGYQEKYEEPVDYWG